MSSQAVGTECSMTSLQDMLPLHRVSTDQQQQLLTSQQKQLCGWVGDV